MPGIFDIFARVREKQGFAQDVAALQRFQQQQLAQRQGTMPIIAPQFPRAQSLAGGELFSNFLLEQQQIAGRPVQSGFTLGKTRFDASGRPIAQVPQEPLTRTQEQAKEIQRLQAIPTNQRTPEQQTNLNSLLLPTAPQLRAGRLQIAKAGDKTGLPAGTVYQAGPQGRVTIISKPGTLTIDEQRKRDLIAAGIKPKAISNLERELLQTQISKNRAEAEAKLRAGKGILTPEQKISQTNIFRKEFDALSKDFRTIRDSFERMKAATIDPSGAGDIAVIFNFMKILDPGSVVRESEFATAENAAGVPDAIRNLWNKALTGEKIAFNRDDFIRTAENLIKAQQNTQKTLINRYTKLSNRFGLNPQDVITEVEGGQPTVPTSSQAIPFTPEDIDAELRRRGAIK